MISRHAIQRYQERVANVPDEAVIASLSCPALKAAMAWARTCTVRLGTGHRCIVIDGVVVTVITPERRPPRIKRPV